MKESEQRNKKRVSLGCVVVAFKVLLNGKGEEWPNDEQKKKKKKKKKKKSVITGASVCSVWMSEREERERKITT
jgi:hypothetical protein